MFDFYGNQKDSIPFYEGEVSDEFDFICRMATQSLKESEFLFYKMNSVLNFNLCSMEEIKIWEKELGIEGEKDLLLSQRRNIVKAKYFSIYNDFNKVTLEKISRLIGSSTYHCVVVSPGEHIVIWVSLDELMTKKLSEIISEVKPAHLKIQVENSKNWNYALHLGNWNDVKGYGKWNNLEN